MKFLFILPLILTLKLSAGAKSNQDPFSQMVAEANLRQAQDQKFVSTIYEKVTKNPENHTENLLGTLFKMFDKGGMIKAITKVVPSNATPNSYVIYFDYFTPFRESSGITITVKVAIVNRRPAVVSFVTEDKFLPVSGWGNK